MGVKMKHQPSNPKARAIFTGPRADGSDPEIPSQKPKTCSKCGAPVVLAYRVYETKTDREGNRRVTRGQYEVAHIDKDERPMFDACPVPTLLDELREKLRLEDNVFNDKKIVHMEDERSKQVGILRVLCGAKGSLWTTLDTKNVTCSNCLNRVVENAAAMAGRQPETTTTSMKSSTKPNKEIETVMSTTTQSIKEKIAAAKAKKAGAGAAATLVPDADGVPLPKTTGGVKKQQVQTARAAAKPKMLNLCGCGCAAAVKANFAPGHDARLHGWIKKLAAGTMALAEVAPQVRDGMYKGVKQAAVKDSEGNLTLAGVAPTTTEADYLAMLKGKGGLLEE